jgi:GNAT superfamily N-acetyltransferase
LSTAGQPKAAGSPIEVEEVLTRRQRDVFVRVPWKIYRDDPLWVPPLLMERKEFIDRRHPFYRHGSAAMYVARRGGQVAGRVLVSDDARYNEYHGSSLGCFGMFESVDDQQVAHALLNAAATWLLARGRSAMWGPIDYSMNYQCGLLVQGFETPARVMMNHNPPYYASLIESYGLAKVKDLYSWWFTDPHDMLSKWRRRTERAVERSGVTVRAFRLRDMNAELMRCKTIYNESWAKSFGFVPMTDAEFLHYGKSLKHVAVPEMLCLAEVDDRPVAFCMTLPDFNEAIKPLNGRLTRWGLPVGLWKFQRGLKRIRTARLVTLGILEPYRRRGIAELLILRTLEYGKNVLHYTGAELGWTLEDNDPINHTIEAVGGERYKTYRLYEKTLA